jgi:predicted transcriptional regulator
LLKVLPGTSPESTIYQELLFPEHKSEINPLYMSTLPELNIDGFFDSIITSYETRIQKIQTAFQSSENITESSHSLFDNVHSSLNDLRKERDLLNSRLCETVAKNGSLRKKDYNTLMSGILNALDEKEKEAENQFLIFIESQKETAQSLKNSILGIKDLAAQDFNEKITIIKEQLFQISKLQEMRKEAVMKTFTDFQQMHNRMMECLENLLKKGDHILIQDIKKVREQIIKQINPLMKLSEGVN